MPGSGCPAAQLLKLSLVRTPALSHLADIFAIFLWQLDWKLTHKTIRQYKDQYVGKQTIFYLQLSPLNISPIECHPLTSALPVWNLDTPSSFLLLKGKMPYIHHTSIEVARKSLSYLSAVSAPPLTLSPTWIPHFWNKIATPPPRLCYGVREGNNCLQIQKTSKGHHSCLHQNHW